MRAHEAGGGPESIAYAEDELRAKLALSGPSGMTFGAYLNGVDEDEHGIALVRVESDASETREQKVMIIDTVAISPLLPPQYRPALEAAVSVGWMTVAITTPSSCRLVGLGRTALLVAALPIAELRAVAKSSALDLS